MPSDDGNARSDDAWRETLRSSFSACAETYHACRPGYPAQIRDLVLKGIDGSAARLLEIGCGSGQATRLFVGAVREVLAVDLSHELLAIARAQAWASDSVSFVEASFEDVPLPREHFNVVLSAQAFHWIPLEIGLRKVHDCLAPGGRIALVWNFVDFGATIELRQLRSLFLKAHPVFQQLPDYSHAAIEQYATEWRCTLEATAAFDDVDARILENEEKLVLAQWLQTVSWFQRLDLRTQVELLQEARRVSSSVPLHTVLVLGTRSLRLARST